MYREFYGLREKPFNVTSDPNFLYMSKRHKEAFSHLSEVEKKKLLDHLQGAYQILRRIE